MCSSPCYHHGVVGECRVLQLILSASDASDDVCAIALRCLRDPTVIVVRQPALYLDGTRHWFVDVEQRWKLETLVDILETVDFSQVLVRCGTSRLADETAAHLEVRRLLAVVWVCVVCCAVCGWSRARRSLPFACGGACVLYCCAPGCCISRRSFPQQRRPRSTRRGVGTVSAARSSDLGAV